MEFFTFDRGGEPGSVSVSRFRGVSGVEEAHLIVLPEEGGDFERQLDWVCGAYGKVLGSLGLAPGTAVFRRFFCSDLANQQSTLEACSISNPRPGGDTCAVSWVQQPPGPPIKVALWAYHIGNAHFPPETIQEGTSLTLRRGGCEHHWTTGLTCPTARTTHDQTRGILETYDAFLRARNMTLADNAVRTWFFIQNIDVNYAEFVLARREFFAERGLKPETHFVASTGIEGGHTNVAANVALDAYAISGLRPGQIEFLSAPDHLSPTYVYGVTFERGTSVAWRDRKQVFLSGTASIDPEGRIVHPGDLTRQLDRTIENVEALLRHAGATLKDLCVVIAYIRDPGDHAVAWKELQRRFGNVPIALLVSPVCRPGWLIEVEGIAIIPACNPELPPF